MAAPKILLPTDFSTCSHFALDLACVIAEQQQASLVIVHVEESPQAARYPKPGVESKAVAADPDELQRMLVKLQPTKPQVPVRYRLIAGFGSIAHQIVLCAQEEQVDLIVMGSHGRTGLHRLLLGSIAEQVVRTATQPVIVVRQPTPLPASTSPDELRELSIGH